MDVNDLPKAIQSLIVLTATPNEDTFVRSVKVKINLSEDKDDYYEGQIFLSFVPELKLKLVVNNFDYPFLILKHETLQITVELFPDTEWIILSTSPQLIAIPQRHVLETQKAIDLSVVKFGRTA